MIGKKEMGHEHKQNVCLHTHKHASTHPQARKHTHTHTRLSNAKPPGGGKKSVLRVDTAYVRGGMEAEC